MILKACRLYIAIEMILKCRGERQQAGHLFWIAAQRGEEGLEHYLRTIRGALRPGRRARGPGSARGDWHKTMSLVWCIYNSYRSIQDYI